MITKVDIFSGFLGAGKTSLIKKLIEEEFSGQRLAIIENEFGEIGIDGSILKHSGVAVRELTSGCICCTLTGDFEKAIEEVVAAYSPDRIIIEPSGVAKLSEIISLCKGDKLQGLLAVNMIITVVDALKYPLYKANFGEFFDDQIGNAGTLVLSRTGKISDSDLESLVGSLRQTNPAASVMTTPWETLSAERILAVAEGEHSILQDLQMGKHEPERLGLPLYRQVCRCDSRQTEAGNAYGTFEVWGIETPLHFVPQELEEMVRELGNEERFGTVLRGKGIVQTSCGSWVQFDYVPGEYDQRPVFADYTGRLCVIGKELNRTELCRHFGISV